MTQADSAATEERADAAMHWREQAEGGGLPMPGRRRWQPLRVGVVNLWEFDRAEAWYADGRLQLAGANESGKSTLMTLTTLLLLAGDVSSYNIDTLGSATKKFRFYVEPSDHSMDRREKNAKKYRGWAWAEYGRLTGDGPEFFTTLLFAQARVGDNDMSPPTWCTLLGHQRVRAGLTLVESGLPVEPGQVKNIVGFEQHPSGEKYRGAIARTMFDGNSTVLTQLIRVLRVLRTPKIGARFEVDDLATAFRHALPAIDDDEIDQLSQDWDELERMRTEQDNAEQALAAITQFTNKYWLAWAHSEIRQAADPVLATRDALKQARRNETKERSTLDKCADELTSVDEQIGTAEKGQQQARTQKETLQKQQEYKEAESATANARSLREQADKAAERSRRTAGRVDAANNQFDKARERHDTARDNAEQADRKREQLGRAVATAAGDAGYGELVDELIERGDIARLTHLASHRQKLADHLRGLLHTQDQAEQRAGLAHEQLRDAETQHRAAVEAAVKVDSEVEQATAAVAHQLVKWTSQLPESPPSADLIETWMAQVTAIAEAPQPTPVLKELLLHQHFLPLQSELTGQRQSQQQELTAAVALCDQITGEIEQLSAQTEPSPPSPYLWSRRPRPEGISDSGAPLWRLVDPLPETSTEQVAMLEATLDAASLLQAWITPDGSYRTDRDGHETVWQLAPQTRGTDTAHSSESQPDSQDAGSPHRQRTLRSVLAPATGLPDNLRDVVEQLLASVAYTETLNDDTKSDNGTQTAVAEGTPGSNIGTTRVTIAHDGHWQFADLTGGAAPAHDGAELLGTAAREAARQRRLEQLNTALATADAHVNELTQQVADLAARLDALNTAYNNPPSDTAVVATIHSARQATELVASRARELTKAQDAVRKAREAVETATREVISFADEHHMPRHHEELEAVASALAALRTNIGDFDAAGQVAATLHQALIRAEQDLWQRQEEFRTVSEESRSEQEEAQRLHTAAKEAGAALSLQGKEILNRVAELDHTINSFDTNLQLLREKQRDLLEARTTAKSSADTATQRRQAVESEHADALQHWWEHLDTGIPELCGITVSLERSPETAIEDADAVTQAISIVGWEPGTPQATNHARRKWEALTGQLPELRSQLEALSSRTATLSEPSDTDPTQRPSVDLIIDGSGRPYPPPVAVQVLQQQLDQLKANYDAELDHAINELLGSTFVEHLRDRLVEVESLRLRINDKLKASPTTTSSLTLQLVRVPVSEERDANEVLKVLEKEGVTFMPAATQAQIKQFLVSRVAEAQEAARAHGETDWRKRLEHTLDYRRWFDLKLEYSTASTGKSGKRMWVALERAEHDTFSGGARVVTLLAPFIAALQAMYDQHPNAPRLMWLDEAFDGVDPPNKTALFRLLSACDLDWMMAGPGMLANNPEVPFAAIVTTCRAPKPLPGVFFETMLWNGKATTHITTPDPADLPELVRPLPDGVQAMALDTGLFDSPQ
ncbi:Putative exonuclease SbcCD, C subunit [Saccharopolyspora antimicrobica]|uniref:Exonuclease SbcCD C subunit n=1 Tax=Saccharopolyspora antimicrobica TaxID=455193 RepID=A0A1I5ATR8_9PSEU|nr:SbcC/MukB-like Walker B domain-containing protein [Saccharopolyspora antimicrobica]RKT86363.1 putative exonuclease SbcCD C subunit [Saccharopolyspora antimicrobica]SFN65821.1 Putative exonuclease SbcCD, C subunit [Saccharopolyspora antimicrobica]